MNIGDVAINFETVDLPSSWGVVAVSDALIDTKFRVGKVKRGKYLPAGALPIIDQSQTFVAGYTDDLGLAYDGQLPVIVFGDHTRILKFVGFRFVCGADGTKVLTPDTGAFDPEFLFYALCAVDLPSRGYNRHFSFLREKALPRPGLEEQRAIAYVLRTVQRAREATEQVIAAGHGLKRSLSRHLFAYGPVPIQRTAEIETRETQAGRSVPTRWEDASIGSFAVVRAGHGFPHRYQGRTSGEYPFFKVSDMTLPGNARVMSRANNYVDEDVVRALKGKPMPVGTSVFPKVGAALLTNKKRMLGANALVDNNIMGVTVESVDKCLEDFLHAWLETIDLADWSNPGPLPSITGTTVKRAVVPLPSATEQNLIVEIIAAVSRKIAAEEQLRDALDALFRSLLHDLMTGKGRVSSDLVDEASESSA